MPVAFAPDAFGVVGVVFEGGVVEGFLEAVNSRALSVGMRRGGDDEGEANVPANEVTDFRLRDGAEDEECGAWVQAALAPDERQTRV